MFKPTSKSPKQKAKSNVVPNNKKNSVKALFNPAGLKLTNLREKKLITSNKSL